MDLDVYSWNDGNWCPLVIFFFFILLELFDFLLVKNFLPSAGILRTQYFSPPLVFFFGLLLFPNLVNSSEEGVTFSLRDSR